MTDTLAFPTIDDAELARVSAAPSAQKTEVATAAAGALDLDKLDLSKLAIARFAPVRKQLADARKTLTGAVHDLSTQAKVDDAKSLRQRLINAPLADARKVSKGLKSKLKSTSEDVGAELESIEADAAETAKLITPQIEAREAELAAEKAEREAKEAARRQEFEDKVAGIRNYLALAQGLPSPRIEKGVTFLTAMVIGDEWAEFQPIAQKAVDETLAGLRELLVKTQAAEVEAAERERQRLEAEQREREIAAERQRLAEERAAIERERAELAAARAAAVPPKVEPPAPSAADVRFHPGNVDVSVHTDGQTAVLVAAPSLQTATTTTEGVAALMSGAAQGQAVTIAALADVATHGLGVTSTSVDAGTGELNVTHVPLIDVVKADPPAPADRTGALPLLLAHIAEAFEGKFPSQPKPSVEWWAELKRLAAEVAR